MGLLRLLGIEKYLKKVKTYVDEENVKDRAYTDKKVSENKTATPDWDAESWEAGYIKNRTHGLTDLTVLTKNGETAYGMLETQYLKLQDELFPISRGETVILRQGPHISVTYENGQLTLNDPEDFAESFGGVAVAIGINRISEHYIPDTIARKNQLTHGLNDYKGTLNAGNTSVNLIGGEVIYAQKGGTIKELWEGDEWDIELWDESQGKSFAVKVTNTGLNVTLTGDVSHLTSNIGIYGRLEQIAEAYMPDTIARYSQIEDLYNALEALTNRIEWHSVYEGDMKNMLDQNLTLSQMTQLGFSAVINNPYTIKGVIVEGDVNTTALAVSSIHSANGDVYGIEFGNISKHDTGAELILSKNMDGTWVITYIEA